jgi:hexokinase
MPGSAAPASWEKFISRVADLTEPLAPRSGKIGFCFSYPTEITPDRDGRVLELTKQVKLAGASGKLVGASLLRELGRRGIAGRRLVLLNDTVAALLGGAVSPDRARYGGLIGLVWGPGVNTCCGVKASAISKLTPTFPHPAMLVNLESGGFSRLPQGRRTLNWTPPRPIPAKVIMKKWFGRYLGELVRLTVLLGGEDGLFSPGMTAELSGLSSLDAAGADAFCVSPKGQNPLARLCKTGRDRELTYAMIEKLIDRAARLVCANLAAIFLLTGAGTVPGKPACVMTDGSVIHKSKLARPLLEQHLENYPPAPGPRLHPAPDRKRNSFRPLPPPCSSVNRLSRFFKEDQHKTSLSIHPGGPEIRFRAALGFMQYSKI